MHEPGVLLAMRDACISRMHSVTQNLARGASSNHPAVHKRLLA